MTDFSRRSFLGVAGFGLATSMTSSLRGAAAPFARPFIPPPRLFQVFLRGAQDGVATVLPVGDPTVVGATGARSRLWPTGFPPTVALRGSTFARLHQNYQALAAADLAGHVAWIHQAGSQSASRSHFTEQQIYETLDQRPAWNLNREGYVPRMKKRIRPTGPGLWGASVSAKPQRAFLTTDPSVLTAHIKSLAQYDVAYQRNAALAGRQRTTASLQTAPAAGTPAEQIFRTAQFALATEAAVGQIAYTPDPARFPRDNTQGGLQGLPLENAGMGDFMRRCEEAMHVLLHPDSRVVGVEVGGWDTHGDQVATRDVLDRWLAHALKSLYDLTRGLNVVILVVTEFGRTNRDNGNFGTDHGRGGLMIAIGERSVVGGTYNCHNGGGLGAAWNNLGTFGLPDIGQNIATDFRTVYAELLQKRFGATMADLNVIIPGWAAIAGTTPQTTALNCFV